MASRDPKDLHPWVRAKWEAFKGESVYPLLLLATYRSPEEQIDLVNSGRSNAGPGESAHNYGLAFDCIPVDADGTPRWKFPLWQDLYALADRVGLDALGAKGGEYLPWDKGHFQEPGWKIVRNLLGPNT